MAVVGWRLLWSNAWSFEMDSVCRTLLRLAPSSWQPRPHSMWLWRTSGPWCMSWAPRSLFRSPVNMKPARSVCVLKLTGRWQVGVCKQVLNRNGDGSVVNTPDSWLKGCGFESLQQQENFLFQGWLSVLTLVLISVPPPCYRSSTYKIPVILSEVHVAGYS